MSGVDVKITADDAAALAALDKLAGLESHLPPILSSIGEYAVDSTQARMAREETPEGGKFAPLNPLYAASKAGPRILTESGTMAGTLFWQLDGNASVRWGSAAIQARIHQFGGTITAKAGKSLAFMLGANLVMVKSVTLPARPYLGISAEDRAEIPEIVKDGIAILIAPPATPGPAAPAASTPGAAP